MRHPDVFSAVYSLNPGLFDLIGGSTAEEPLATLLAALGRALIMFDPPGTFRNFELADDRHRSRPRDASSATRRSYERRECLAQLRILSPRTTPSAVYLRHDEVAGE